MRREDKRITFNGLDILKIIEVYFRNVRSSENIESEGYGKNINSGANMVV